MSERVDKSNHPTVVEYAVRDLFKGKSPAAAARFTAKKLSGSENLFLGSGVVDIDPKVLEDNLWERMAASAVSAIPHLKPGMEHYAIDGTLQQFKQKATARKELERRVILRLKDAK